LGLKNEQPRRCISTSEIQNSIIRILLRIGRVAIYLFGFWTTFFYFWSIQGILIGVILAAILGAGVWRRHGLVLSYTSVIFALSIAVYAWVWLLLSMLFLIGYIGFYAILNSARYVILGVRKVLKKEKEPTGVTKESRFRRSAQPIEDWCIDKKTNAHTPSQDSPNTLGSCGTGSDVVQHQR
jgi:hypothetical protein